MASLSTIVGGRTYSFAHLRELMAKATPLRSGGQLAGLAAGAAFRPIADLTVGQFREWLQRYKTDENVLTEAHQNDTVPS